MVVDAFRDEISDSIKPIKVYDWKLHSTSSSPTPTTTTTTTTSMAVSSMAMSTSSLTAVTSPEEGSGYGVQP